MVARAVLCKRSEDGNSCGLYNLYFDFGTADYVRKNVVLKGDKHIQQNDPKHRHKGLCSGYFLFSSTSQWCLCLDDNLGKNILLFFFKWVDSSDESRD